MITLDEFVLLARDELGLPIGPDDAARPFDDLAGWDSVYLLSLVTLVERRTGREVSLPAVLEARSLAQVHAVATA